MLTLARIIEVPFMSLFLAMKKTIKGIQNWEACSRRFPIPTLLSRYFNIAKNRLDLATEDSLPYREIEKPIFDPKDAGAVGRPPKKEKV